MTELAIGSGRPILVGGLGPLTTPGIPQAGEELLTGMELAVDLISRAGGLLGRPLELRFADTRGIPAAGEALAQSLQAEGASVLLGGYHSVVADAISASTWLQVPFICSSAVLDSITARRSPLVFRICPPPSRGWRLFARYIEEAGYRRVVSLIEPNIYWSSGARIIRWSLTKSTSELVEIEIARQGDVSPAVAEILSYLSPRLLILLLVGYPEPLRSLVAGLRQELPDAGIALGDPAGRTIFTTWNETVGHVYGSVPFLCYLIPSRLTPTGKEFVAAYRKRVGRDPSFVAFEGYDSVLAFAEAVRRAGTPDADELVQALRDVSIDGTRATISFGTEDEGVVHQQWQSAPLCVAAYDGPEQSLSSLKVLATA